MQSPQVSVLMPVFNTADYISEAIDSILNQTFNDFELIIIDDASNDNSVRLIKGFNDPRIKLITKSINTGYTDSLNMGLKVAKGKYIARMDSDDISLSIRLEKQVQFLNNNPDIILCGTWFQLLDVEKTIVKHPTRPEEIKIALLNYCSIGHPTVMFRNDIYRIYGLVYDREMEPAEDYNLWTEISKIGKLANIGEVLLKYRIHQNQASNLRAEQQKLNSKTARVKMLQHLDEGLRLDEIFPETFNGIITRTQLKATFNKLKQLEEINFTKKDFDVNLFPSALNAFKREVAFKYFLLDAQHDLYSLWLLLTENSYYKLFPKKTLIKLSLKCIIHYKNTS